MNVEHAGTHSERTIVLIAYVLHLIGATIGITSIVGLILNYLRRGQYGEPLASHHRWMIRSFWWGLVWLCVGVITWIIGVGMVICFITWVWYVYRHIRGLVALSNGESMPG